MQYVGILFYWNIISIDAYVIKIFKRSFSKNFVSSSILLLWGQIFFLVCCMCLWNSLLLRLLSLMLFLICGKLYIGDFQIGLITFDIMLSINNSSMKSNFTELTELIAHELDVKVSQVWLSYLLLYGWFKILSVPSLWKGYHLPLETLYFWVGSWWHLAQQILFVSLPS